MHGLRHDQKYKTVQKIVKEKVALSDLEYTGNWLPGTASNQTGTVSAHPFPDPESSAGTPDDRSSVDPARRPRRYSNRRSRSRRARSDQCACVRNGRKLSGSRDRSRTGPRILLLNKSLLNKHLQLHQTVT